MFVPAAWPSPFSTGSFPSTYKLVTMFATFRKAFTRSFIPSPATRPSLYSCPRKTSEESYLHSVSNSSSSLNMIFIFRMVLALNNRKL